MSSFEVATVILGILVPGLGFWNAILWGQITKLNARMEKLPDTYARRDDLKDAEDKILRAIGDLSNRIDMLIRGNNG
jgi:hypothetical protein